MMSLSSTVLPQPLSPISPSVWPCVIERLISRSTGCRPKLTPSSCSSMSGDADSFVLLSFVAITRQLSAHQIRPDKIMHFVQTDAEKESQHQNDHERQHEGRGRSPANALRTRR